MEIKLADYRKQLKSHKETLRAKEQSDMMQKQTENDILQLKKVACRVGSRDGRKAQRAIAVQRETEKALMQAKKDGLKMQREASGVQEPVRKAVTERKTNGRSTGCKEKIENTLQMKG